MNEKEWIKKVRQKLESHEGSKESELPFYDGKGIPKNYTEWFVIPDQEKETITYF